MPQPQRYRNLSLAVGTAAASGLGMIPVHRLPRPVRTGYVVLPALLTTGISLIAQQGHSATPDGGGDAASARGLRAPTLSEAALSLTLGGLIAGAGAAGLRLDRAAENLLRRRGVRAPRVWIGLAAGAVTLATTLLDAPDDGVDDGEERGRERTELEDRVLAVLTAEDPMGLTPGTDSTPADEYALKAEDIAELLRSGVAPTAERLDEIWEGWFSEPLSPLLGEERMEALLEALSAPAARPDLGD